MVKRIKPLTVLEIFSQISFQLKADMIWGLKKSDKRKRLNITEFALYYKKIHARRYLFDYKLLQSHILFKQNIFSITIEKIDSSDSTMLDRRLKIKFNQT